MRKRIGRNKHSEVIGFLNNSSKTEVNAITKTWKKWIPIVWKRAIPSLRVSSIFQVKQKSMQFPKYRKREFPCFGKYMRKYKLSMVVGSLNAFWGSKNSHNPQNIRWVGFHFTGRVWENKKYLQMIGSLKYLG